MQETSRKLKILVGVVEIGRHAWDMADGLRRLGHEVDTVMSWLNQQHPELRYTVENFRQDALAHAMGSFVQNPLAQLLGNFSWASRIHELFTKYDLYIIQYGDSLLPRNADFSLLKQLGKKIVTVFNGDDIRHWSGAKEVWESFGLKLPEMYLEEPRRSDHKAVDCLWKARMAERYADVIFADQNFAGLLLRPYSQRYMAVNRSLFKFNIPDNEVPIVVHAPSVRGVKNTELILATLDRLKEEGVKFELQLLEGRRNEEVREILSKADILIDQMEFGHYGMLALEGMASGCAVAGPNHPGFEPLPEDRPLVPLDSRNVYENCRRIITDRALRLSLTGRGDAYIQKYHDHVRVMEHVLKCVFDGAPLDHYPTYCSLRYRLPPYETMPQELREIGTHIIEEWGIPLQADLQDMDSRQIIALDKIKNPGAIKRWIGEQKLKQRDWGNEQ